MLGALSQLRTWPAQQMYNPGEPTVLIHSTSRLTMTGTWTWMSEEHLMPYLLDAVPAQQPLRLPGTVRLRCKLPDEPGAGRPLLPPASPSDAQPFM